MRNATAALLLAFVAASAATYLPAPSAAFAQDDHGVEKEIPLSDLTAEQKAAALDGWAHVYCRCDRENWSRTLSNCPDGCAMEQKQMVVRGVLAGRSLKDIVAEQVQAFGPRAAADPGTASNGSLLVVAGFLIAAGSAGFVLARWKRGAESKRSAAGEERRTRPVASAEADAIERELREID
ncbi:MAG: hypothetical protein K8T90_10835 [Planctomycetes bacterium]|nr:hypothetical protein [Planctomycetota bacterium]